jgi:hypothetical protein
MFVVSTKVSGKESLEKILDAIEDIPTKAVSVALNRWKLVLGSEIKKALTGGVLKRRTGKLLRSNDPFKNLVVEQTGKGKFTVELVNAEIYGAALETGDLVPASPGATRLTIPLPQVSGYPDKPTPLKRFKKTFVQPTKSPGPPDRFTVYWKRTKKEAIPIYVLQWQSQLPERPWFATAVEAALPRLPAMFDKALKNFGPLS